MKPPHSWSRLFAYGLAALLYATGLALPASAQNGNDRFDIPDDATSEDNRNLERILERFPESDADDDGILTADEGRRFLEERTEEWEERRRNRGRGNRQRGPTHRDIAYGDSPQLRIDLYLAPIDEDNPGATPLVIYFHGGQFISGNKGDIQIRSQELLENGVSVASVGYRFAREDPFPASFEDAARAVQFLRLNADQYNLNPERFATAGQDAGANLALYVALHDDLAERPSTEERASRNERDEDLDPYDEVGLAMQSTRVMGVVALDPLASFDPRYWREQGLPLNNHERYLPAWLGVNFLEPLNDPELIAIINDVSPAALVSEDDPPLLMISSFQDLAIDEETSWTIMRLHPRQSQLIAEGMRRWGNRAVVRYRGMPNDPGTSSADFLLELFEIEPK